MLYRLLIRKFKQLWNYFVSLKIKRKENKGVPTRKPNSSSPFDDKKSRHTVTVTTVEPLGCILAPSAAVVEPSNFPLSQRRNDKNDNKKSLSDSHQAPSPPLGFLRGVSSNPEPDRYCAQRYLGTSSPQKSVMHSENLVQSLVSGLILPSLDHIPELIRQWYQGLNTLMEKNNPIDPIDIDNLLFQEEILFQRVVKLIEEKIRCYLNEGSDSTSSDSEGEKLGLSQLSEEQIRIILQLQQLWHRQTPLEKHQGYQAYIQWKKSDRPYRLLYWRLQHSPLFEEIDKIQNDLGCSSTELVKAFDQFTVDFVQQTFIDRIWRHNLLEWLRYNDITVDALLEQESYFFGFVQYQVDQYFKDNEEILDFLRYTEAYQRYSIWKNRVREKFRSWIQECKNDLTVDSVNQWLSGENLDYLIRSEEDLEKEEKQQGKEKLKQGYSQISEEQERESEVVSKEQKFQSIVDDYYEGCIQLFEQYDRGEITADVFFKQVRADYIKKSLRLHPDKVGDNDYFAVFQRIYAHCAVEDKNGNKTPAKPEQDYKSTECRTYLTEEERELSQICDMLIRLSGKIETEVDYKQVEEPINCDSIKEVHSTFKQVKMAIDDIQSSFRIRTGDHVLSYFWTAPQGGQDSCLCQVSSLESLQQKAQNILDRLKKHQHAMSCIRQLTYLSRTEQYIKIFKKILQQYLNTVKKGSSAQEKIRDQLRYLGIRNKKLQQMRKKYSALERTGLALKRQTDLLESFIRRTMPELITTQSSSEGLVDLCIKQTP